LYRHRKLNPSSPPFTKGRNYPSLAKRGEGRFSEQYVYSIMDSSVIHFKGLNLIVSSSRLSSFFLPRNK